MASLIIAIAGLVLSLAGYGVSEGLQGYGNNLRSRLTRVANQIYSKISRNNQLLDKLYSAYSKNDSSLTNSLITTAGFGPAVIAIRKEIEKNEKSYNEAKQKLNDQNTTLTNKYNEANQAISNTGSSLAGTIGSGKIADQLEQYIQGGMQSEEEVQETK